MGTARILPPPLSSACAENHPLELWILVNGEIVQCTGVFLPTDEQGHLQVSANLPEGFVGVMRTGAAVRGFFTDPDGAVHTFLTSIHEWVPYKDRPSAAQALLEAPSLVAPCQRRRGDRVAVRDIPVRLSVTIRGRRESVIGRLVDISPSGLAVRVVRTGRNWFPVGARLDVDVQLPDRAEPVRLTASVARVSDEALHFLLGMRVEGGGQGRRSLSEILDRLI
jgi:hypothetical protein